MPLPVDRRWRFFLLAILIVGLALRIGAACSLQYLLDHRWHRTFLIEGDADGYWQLAQRVAAGETYAIYTPPRYVLRMPGFPALLAVPIVMAGPSLFAARLMLAVVGAATCWLVYLLGQRVANERVGTVAAAFAAFSPTLLLFSVEVLSETAFAATLLIGLICGQKLFTLLNADELRWPVVAWQALLTGVAVAAGVYMRPSWLLAGPIVGVLLCGTARRGRHFAGGAAGVLVVLGMVLALLPWGLRNQAVTGHFTLTTFWMGPSLYDGLNPHATGDSDMRFYDADALMTKMSEYEVDQHYRGAAWVFARNSPGRTLELAALKAWRYWKPWPNAEQFRQPAAILAVCVVFVPLMVLALMGSWHLFVCSQAGGGGQLRTAIWSVALLAGPIFYFAGLHMIFVSSLRYRLPAEYPVLVLSAIGLLAWLDRRRPRE
ncbi:ArnT family glycosyltransferase [Planctomicrobium piriforme]|uniref:Dolichyl-phosphate-mannose-protein mannosyltransferase n=1 Tax=Planctomicrobium piriforme TaxID=1576369 RepID=A0A1I3LBB1_9PLAN|nr:glycosyltransferase family 39 protein [Planctomicrobium piriforme]SFI82029.1 Dolichyl-phosphate-mannose-protein mannosyltransferase [Planctomicrobium piriforme]